MDKKKFSFTAIYAYPKHTSFFDYFAKAIDFGGSPASKVNVDQLKKEKQLAYYFLMRIRLISFDIPIRFDG